MVDDLMGEFMKDKYMFENQENTTICQIANQITTKQALPKRKTTMNFKTWQNRKNTNSPSTSV